MKNKPVIIRLDAETKAALSRLCGERLLKIQAIGDVFFKMLTKRECYPLSYRQFLDHILFHAGHYGTREKDCPQCDGRGIKNKKVCKACNGSGTIWY